MKSHLHITILTAVAALFLHTSGTTAQNITEIAKSDPLIITGSVGTQNTYFHSTAGSAYASPLSNTLFLNLNISMYGFNMPFSLYYSNNNLDFNYPHISFNLSPSYKQWHGHIGRSSAGFSPYVMSMSYNGVGLEYRTQKFRVGAFYGTLRSAVNDDPTSPSPRNPQYRRIGWGFNIGYGTGSNYLDLYLPRIRPPQLHRRVLAGAHIAAGEHRGGPQGRREHQELDVADSQRSHISLHHRHPCGEGDGQQGDKMGQGVRHTLHLHGTLRGRRQPQHQRRRRERLALLSHHTARLYVARHLLYG